MSFSANHNQNYQSRHAFVACQRSHYPRPNPDCPRCCHIPSSCSTLPRRASFTRRLQMHADSLPQSLVTLVMQFPPCMQNASNLGPRNQPEESNQIPATNSSSSFLTSSTFLVIVLFSMKVPAPYKLGGGTGEQVKRRPPLPPEDLAGSFKWPTLGST